jgi:hypothetical protein
MGLAHRRVIVKTKAIGLLGGVVFGFTLAWARLTDPRVIRDMLLLNEPHAASLHDQLLTLPDDLEIYPGHFSGSVCGTRLSGKPTSTLAFEKRWNSMLSLDREAFIEALSDVPPKPADMERVLAFNRGHEEAGARA